MLWEIYRGRQFDGLAQHGISGAICPMVQRYQTQIVRVIVTGITLVPLAQKEESARLGGYPLEPKVEKTRSRCPLGGMYSMKRSLLIFAVLIAIATAGVQPAAAPNRYIVRTTGRLGSALT